MKEPVEPPSTTTSPAPVPSTNFFALAFPQISASNLRVTKASNRLISQNSVSWQLKVPKVLIFCRRLTLKDFKSLSLNGKESYSQPSSPNSKNPFKTAIIVLINAGFRVKEKNFKNDGLVNWLALVNHCLVLVKLPYKTLTKSPAPPKQAKREANLALRLQLLLPRLRK